MVILGAVLLANYIQVKARRKSERSAACDPRELSKARRAPPQKKAGERRGGGARGGGLIAPSPQAPEASLECRIPSPGQTSLVRVWQIGPSAGATGKGAQGAPGRSGGGRLVRRRERVPSLLPSVTPSAGIRTREHLLVLSPKAWSGALSCDWPTRRPSRVAKTHADWAIEATFSSHP